MSILRLFAALPIFILLMPTDASAHCDGDKHGPGHPHCANSPPPPPPPPPPPSGCADTFPSFVYWVRDTRKTPGEMRLASSEACRTELLSIGETAGQMHLTSDRSKGVVVWSEDIQGDNQYVVRRLDFTVNLSGELVAEQPVIILPLDGEEPLPGEGQYYEVGDIWGDETHGALYLTVSRQRQFNSGPNGGKHMKDVMIYDLNDLTDVSAIPAPPAPDVRSIYHHLTPVEADADSWQWLDATSPTTVADCASAPYPQFIPACYKSEVPKFNASGTRLYIDNGFRNELQDSEVESWHSIMRMDVDKETVGTDLGDWIISEPELVVALDFQGYGGPEGLVPRPGADTYTLPDPEIVARSETFLNGDACVAQYAPFADGNTLLSDDLWLTCTDTSLVGHTGFGNSQVWESANTYLFDRNGSRKSGGEIYRMTVTGQSAGIEQLLITGSRAMDTGL